MRRWLRRIWPVVVLLFVLIGALRWAWVPSEFPRSACARNRNGAWISVDWVSQPINDAAVAKLADSSKTRGMVYLFPYVSYLKSDGNFNQTYAHAKDFVATYRRINSDTKLLAWIGLPLTTTVSGISGWVNLSNRNTRQQITTFVVKIVTDTEFDGVHLNAEPVLRGNEDFLQLLEEVRQALGPNKLISVAGHHWAADSLIAISGTTLADWSSDYYRAMAKRVDQIAVMTYDSQLTSPALYRLWVREQAKGINQSIANTNAGLLIGLSVSREDTASHHPNAETLADGLAGFCATEDDDASKIEGIAIYADWEFAELDKIIWQTWRQSAK